MTVPRSLSGCLVVVLASVLGDTLALICGNSPSTLGSHSASAKESYVLQPVSRTNAVL
jgi:hypothetical protein